MFELKRQLEKQIDSNYTTTDLFFYGSNYDVSNLDQWVQVMYNPIDSKIVSSDVSCTVEAGSVIVSASDTTLTNAMVLIDEIMTIIHNGTDYNYGNTITFTQGSLENSLWFCTATISVETK